MPAHQAIIEKLVSASPADTVEEVLTRLDKSDHDMVLVVDEEGQALGYITRNIMLNNILPVSVAMQDGINLDVNSASTAAIAKRFHYIQALPISDFMHRHIQTVHPQDALGPIAQTIAQHNSPVIVIEENTSKVRGVITAASLINELKKMGADRK